MLIIILISFGYERKCSKYVEMKSFYGKADIVIISNLMKRTIGKGSIIHNLEITNKEATLDITNMFEPN